jgi:hypothetical protein
MSKRIVALVFLLALFAMQPPGVNTAPGKQTGLRVYSVQKGGF